MMTCQVLQSLVQKDGFIFKSDSTQTTKEFRTWGSQLRKIFRKSWKKGSRIQAEFPASKPSRHGESQGESRSVEAVAYLPVVTLKV